MTGYSDWIESSGWVEKVEKFDQIVSEAFSVGDYFEVCVLPNLACWLNSYWKNFFEIVRVLIYPSCYHLSYPSVLDLGR